MFAPIFDADNRGILNCSNAACRSLQSLDNFHSLSKHSAGDGSKNGYEGQENLSVFALIRRSLIALTVYKFTSLVKKNYLLVTINNATVETDAEFSYAGIVGWNSQNPDILVPRFLPRYVGL